MKRWLSSFLVLVLIAVIGIVVFVSSGMYRIGAATPHWPLTESLLHTLRERSIERHAQGVAVPPLDERQMVLKGAAAYDEMCVVCHLAPGMQPTPVHTGLYPQPPKLAEHGIEPKTAFWVVKHGIKMTGMPAWGETHGDEELWNIVAFLDKLPEMSPQEYQDIVAQASSAGGGHGHGTSGHTHGAAAGQGQGSAPASGNRQQHPQE